MLEGAMDAKSAMAHYSKAADIYKGEVRVPTCVCVCVVGSHTEARLTLHSLPLVMVCVWMLRTNCLLPQLARSRWLSLPAKQKSTTQPCSCSPQPTTSPHVQRGCM